MAGAIRGGILARDRRAVLNLGNGGPGLYRVCRRGDISGSMKG